VTPVTVRFHREARAELREARRWYAARSPIRARQFAEEVDRVISVIAEHPELPAPYLSGTRRMLLRRYPFAVIYRIVGRSVVIMAVAHGSRREGYWLDR
jgi:plasmid stabilization system protein ParE